MRAYRAVPGTAPLVLLGGRAVRRRVRRDGEGRGRGDPRVLLPGAIYGEGYRELLAHAAVYVHATEVGGTHPALLEAMGFGRPLVVHDTPENRETAGKRRPLRGRRAGRRRSPRAIAALLGDSELRRHSGEAARRRARDHYRWDAVTDAYEKALSGA